MAWIYEKSNMWPKAVPKQHTLTALLVLTCYINISLFHLQISKVNSLDNLTRIELCMVRLSGAGSFYILCSRERVTQVSFKIFFFKNTNENKSRLQQS